MPRPRPFLPVALVLAACARSLPHPATSRPDRDDAIERREVTLENGFVSVSLDIPRAVPGRRPVVISPGADRAALLAAGAIVASYGVNWQLLAPLAPPPPPEPPRNTVGVWLLASPTAKTVGQAYFGLISYDPQNAIPHLIDYLETVPEVDPARIGISGASTSGFMALEALANDRRLVAATVLSACGDYHTFLQRSALAMNGKPLDLDRAYDRSLVEREPARHAERITHAAVLMVNGTEDLAVPAPCALSTARAFRRAYRRAGVPERFRFVLLPGAGHNLSDVAHREAMAWWYRWLLRPSASPLPRG